MQQTIPQVSGGRLYQLATDADPIVVGTPTWYDWLEHHTVFLFVDPTGTFTAFKNDGDPSDLTWNASCTHGSQLYRVSLGPSHTLTLQRLQAAAQALADEQAPAEPTEAPAINKEFPTINRGLPAPQAGFQPPRQGATVQPAASPAPSDPDRSPARHSPIPLAHQTLPTTYQQRSYLPCSPHRSPERRTGRPPHPAVHPCRLWQVDTAGSVGADR